jgi:hypothetical protein
MRWNASGILETPTSDLRNPEETLRSLFWVQLGMRIEAEHVAKLE